jgi:Holliday junction DNA helicase RuvB
MNEDFELRKIEITEEEREIDRSIRPKDFNDFNGQEKLVQNLKVFVQAACLRKE